MSIGQGKPRVPADIPGDSLESAGPSSEALLRRQRGRRPPKTQARKRTRRHPRPDPRQDDIACAKRRPSSSPRASQGPCHRILRHDLQEPRHPFRQALQLPRDQAVDAEQAVPSRLRVRVGVRVDELDELL